MSQTSIQWVGRSWGYQQGCSEKSPGCARCYAKRMAQRLAKNPLVPQYTEAIAAWDGTMNLYIPGLIEPLLVKKGDSWFPSMTDPFHLNVPDEWIGLTTLIAALCSQHRFLMLTKRPEGVLEWLESAVFQEVQEGIAIGAFHQLSMHLLAHCGMEDWWDFLANAVDRSTYKDGVHEKLPLSNFLLGASVEDQVRADERMPMMHQLRQKGWHTFISVEPLLEEVNLHLDKYPVDWVIITGNPENPASLDRG